MPIITSKGKCNNKIWSIVKRGRGLGLEAVLDMRLAQIRTLETMP